MINTNVPSIATFAAFVQLKDYRLPTKKEYVRYIRRLGDHYQCDPATLTEDQVRAYYLELRQVRKFGGSAMKVAKCALRCFYREHLKLGLTWTVFEELRIAPPQTLPLVLPREAVATLLKAVELPRYRNVLGLIYHAGLRVGEAVRIELRDLRDTHSEHPRLHVRCGKGGKDRFVLFGKSFATALRTHIAAHPDNRWLFQTRRNSKFTTRRVQQIVKQYAEQAGVKATPHTFRHQAITWLTRHSGMADAELQLITGHARRETLAVYQHVALDGELEEKYQGAMKEVGL
jgi:integrase/recombinase XerD